MEPTSFNVGDSHSACTAVKSTDSASMEPTSFNVGDSRTHLGVQCRRARFNGADVFQRRRPQSLDCLAQVDGRASMEPTSFNVGDTGLQAKG